MKVLKFVGNYGDLKKHGFTFQKLYARNYMQWSKKVKGDHCISVWKKGAEVEIDDLYNLSGIVAEYILNNDPIDICAEGARRVFKDGLVVLRFTLDKENREAVSYDRAIHSDTLYFMAQEGTLKEELKKKLLPDMDVKAFHKRFRVLVLDPELVYAVREMFDCGLIALVDEPAKP